MPGYPFPFIQLNNINRRSFASVGRRTRWLKVSNGAKDSFWSEDFISLQSDSWVRSKNQPRSLLLIIQSEFILERFGSTVFHYAGFGAGSHLSWRAVVSGIHPSSVWPPHMSVQGQRSGQCRRFDVQVAFYVRFTVSFDVVSTFGIWYKAQDSSSSDTEGQHSHECSSHCLHLKWSVQTGRIWRVKTLIPEEDCGLNGCNRENYNYRHAERRRKKHNKAHHWLTLTPPTADILSQRSRARGWGWGSQAMILTVGKDVDATYSRGWRNASPVSWP